MPLFIDALKEYNKNEIKWTVPRKGTEDYNKVIKIMKELKTKSTEQIQPKKEPKQPKKEPKQPKKEPSKVAKPAKPTEKPLQVSTKGDIKI